MVRREIAFYVWEDGASVLVSVSGNVSTLDAIAQVEELFALKKKEIEQSAVGTFKRRTVAGDLPTNDCSEPTPPRGQGQTESAP